MSNNRLLPTSIKNGNGQRGEELDQALMDLAMTQLMNLYLDIDNGTDLNCVKGWIRSYAEQNIGIPPNDVLEVIENIYTEISRVHSTLVAARSTKKT